MDTLQRRIADEVKTVLTSGDQVYLRGLSREELLDVLHSELRFLGLYRLDEEHIAVAVSAFLDSHLDTWRAAYLDNFTIESGSQFLQQPRTNSRGAKLIRVLVEQTTFLAPALATEGHIV